MFNSNTPGSSRREKLEGILEARRKAKGIADDEETVELEKGDLFAMLVGAYIAYLPAVLIPIGVLIVVGWIFTK